MITQASTPFPRKRSFSVHVEMYSRGSNSRGLRSSFTSCWSRIDLRRMPDPGKSFGSVAVPYGGESDHRARRHERECEESEGGRPGGRPGEPAGDREGA